MTTFFSMKQVKQDNIKHGKHFFEASTMRFFHSRVGRHVYGGQYFITSEQQEGNSPRRYTVRQACGNGRIETIGEFMQYASWTDARRAITRLINGPVDVTDEHGNNPCTTWDTEEE